MAGTRIVILMIAPGALFGDVICAAFSSSRRQAIPSAPASSYQGVAVRRQGQCSELQFTILPYSIDFGPNKLVGVNRTLISRPGLKSPPSEIATSQYASRSSSWEMENVPVTFGHFWDCSFAISCKPILSVKIKARLTCCKIDPWKYF